MKNTKCAPLFPMFLKLEGRPCLVVGAGKIGEGKIRSLLVAGAVVRVIAPRARKSVMDWARAGVITWEARSFEPADLDGIFLVIAATASAALNELAFRAAQARQILCNAVDDPQHCDFYFPAVVRRGQLQVAVSTGGRSPALAQRLRRELESQFSPEYAGWLEELGKTRDRLRANDIDPQHRRNLLHSLAHPQAFTSWSSGFQDTTETIHER
jgi:precorrin-2 dehydrogenase / sirohydrochlorin ferrochelatase